MNLAETGDIFVQSPRNYFHPGSCKATFRTPVLYMIMMQVIVLGRESEVAGGRGYDMMV
jgi:hypothetical protein